MASQLHRRAALAVAATVVVLACSGSEGGITTPPDPTAPPADTFSVEIVGPDSLRVNALRAKYEAIVRDQRGTLRPEVGVQWLTDRPAVLRPDANGGWITIHAVGDATITVRARAATDSKLVSVTPLPIDTAYATVDRLQIILGRRVGVPITALDSAGVGTSVAIDAVVEDSTVARFAGSGQFQGLREGSTRAFLSLGGFADTIGVDVVPEPVASVEVDVGGVLPTGSTRQLQALVKGTVGSILSDRSIQWGSSDPSVATVTGDGLVTGIAAGTTMIHAEVEGVRWEAELEVRDLVGRIEIAGPAELRVGASHEFSATTYGPAGNVLSADPVWSVTDTAKARLTSGSTVLALDTGWVYVRAETGGLIASHLLRLRPTIGGVEIVSPPAEVDLGSTVTLEARLLDAAGGVVPGAPMSWVSSPSAVLNSLGDGRFRAVSTGTASVTVSSGGFSATTSMMVRPPAGSRHRVDPEFVRAVPGDTLQFEFSVADASGNPLTGLQAPTVSIDDPSVVVALGEGRFLASTIGSTSISFGWPWGATVDAAVEVALAPVDVAGISVAPPSLTIESGSGAQLTGRVTGSDGSVLNDRTVEWTSSDVGIATVDDAGFVTGINPGIATVSATIDSFTAHSQITVTWASGDVARLEIIPGAAGVAVRDSLEFEVVAYDADGNRVDPGVVDVTALSPDLIQVSGGWLVAGQLFGSAQIAVSAGALADTAVVRVGPRIETIRTGLDSILGVPGRRIRFDLAVRDVQGGWVDPRSWTTVTVVPEDLADLRNDTLQISRVGSGFVRIMSYRGTDSLRVPIRSEVRRVQRVSIDGPDTMRPPDTAVFTARVQDQFDQWGDATNVQWSSTDTLIAAVDSNGLVRAKSEGQVVIRGSSEGVSGERQIRVAPAPVTRVALSDSVVYAEVGDTVQVEVLAWNSLGERVSPALIWQLRGDGLDTIGEGVFVVRKEGISTPVVTTSQRIRSLTVVARPRAVARLRVSADSVVVPLGGTVPFEGWVEAADGTRLEHDVSYGFGASIGTARAENGVIRGLSEGSVLMTVWHGIYRRFVLVRVVRPGIDKVDVTPSAARVEPGESVQLTAEVLDERGRVLSESPTWTTSNPAVAVVDTRGLVTVQGRGSAWIVATAGSRSDSSRVVVDDPSAGTVASLNVIGDGGRIVGLSGYLEVIAMDAAGQPLAGRAPTFRSSDPSVLHVDAAGRTTGMRVGSADITVELDGVTVTRTASVRISVRSQERPHRAVVGIERSIDLDVRDGNDRTVATTPHVQGTGAVQIPSATTLVATTPGRHRLSVSSAPGLSTDALFDIEAKNANAPAQFEFIESRPRFWAYAPIPLIGLMQAVRWDGAPIAAADITWSTPHGSVRIDGDGVFHPEFHGWTTFRAEYMGETAEIQIFVDRAYARDPGGE